MIHNYYQLRGGEDTVFEQEFRLISESENAQMLTMRNKSGVRGAVQFLASIWNVSAAKGIKRKIHSFKPDIIHLHNWHFGIGPIAIRTARRAGIPIVITINNYRLLCPSATFLHDGQLFTESIHTAFPWKAVWKGVYRNSVFMTFWLALVVWFHKKVGTWDKVDKYIMLTEFSKSVFEGSALGVPPEKFFVKPNFTEPPEKEVLKRKDHILFVGRLSPEKGIPLLIEAFRRTNYFLRIAGDGPLRSLVEEAARKYPNISFLGRLDKAAVQEAMMECKALVFPSVWYEGMPMTIIEAFSAGTPVIASNLGAMASMIKHGFNGLHFDKGDAAGLTRQLDALYSLNDEQLSAYYKNSKDTYRVNYSSEKNKEQLLSIYQNLVHAKAIDQY